MVLKEAVCKELKTLRTHSFCLQTLLMPSISIHSQSCFKLLYKWTTFLRIRCLEQQWQQKAKKKCFTKLAIDSKSVFNLMDTCNSIITGSCPVNDSACKLTWNYEVTNSYQFDEAIFMAKSPCCCPD